MFVCNPYSVEQLQHTNHIVGGGPAHFCSMLAHLSRQGLNLAPPPKRNLGSNVFFIRKMDALETLLSCFISHLILTAIFFYHQMKRTELSVLAEMVITSVWTYCWKFFVFNKNLVDFLIKFLKLYVDLL